MTIRIAICAPGKRLERELADAALDLAAAEPDIELVFHKQCFARHGHFAGDDQTRLAALVECANDPDTQAVWFAHGGYGTNRIAPATIAQLNEVGRRKIFLGYSDAGYLLGGLYRHGIARPIHAPMVADIRHDGGEGALLRVFNFLRGSTDGLERELDGRPTVAFNLMTLAMLAGTELMPDLSGHVVMVEEVSEHLYAVDRLFFHVTQHLRGIAGLRLGRISAVPENDRPFGASEEDIARYWCDRAGISYLGFADIGHDPQNKIVPFGITR
jgi:muramoyltetrapeptide carboxypeptidase